MIFRQDFSRIIFFSGSTAMGEWMLTPVEVEVYCKVLNHHAGNPELSSIVEIFGIS